MSEANKDAAMQYLSRATKLLGSGDLAAAKKAVMKSISLYPTPSAQQLLTKIESGNIPSPSPKPSASTSSTTTPTRRPKSTSTTTPSAADSRKPTQANIDIANKVLRTTDLYERLGVSRDATEKEIKRAFLKMSVKIHPDKNPAPKSADAFKAINNACDILCDDSKRRIYNQTGEENANTAQRQANPFQGFGGRRGGHDPAEDLLRQFFQGGFQQPGGTHFTYQFGGNQFGRRQQQQRQQQQQQQPNQQQQPQFGNIMWMIIMIMALSFMWSDDTTQTRFSFYKTRDYSVLRSVQNKAMENNPIQYYVRADTEARIRKDRNKMTTLEEQVFTEYWNSVNKKCSYQGHQASCSKREKYRQWYQQQANKNKNKKRQRHRN